MSVAIDEVSFKVYGELNAEARGESDKPTAESSARLRRCAEAALRA